MCGFVFYTGKDLSQEVFKDALEKIGHRGPDDTEVVITSKNMIGFKRLAIMDLGHAGDQPFVYDSAYVVCNGEIYNYKELKKLVPDYSFKSGSDCEVILPYYKKFGARKLAEDLDAECALVIFDEKTDTIIAVRDPIGIRPLFYGYRKESGKIAFASEIKALQSFCEDIKPFPPGHIYINGEFTQYHDSGHVAEYCYDDLETITKGIHDRLVSGVVKRLQSDAPIGFLLSGGLDSSLVCAIAQKYAEKKPIRTFAIGMSEDAIDLKYAKEVADHIGSEHTEVIITREDVLKSIRDVIYHLESWDITTIRASVGMYLICKYIREKTDIKVLMTGEVSDEIFGYKYTDFAPSADEFQAEAQKRVRELYMYDVLRADRCISAHSLEARVPFSDKEFVRYVMSIDPAKKMNSYGHGKFLLRKAFEGDYLPQSILYREKAAFSDAVGHSLVDCIKEYVESMITDMDVQSAVVRHAYCTPFTKESLYYREIFAELYPNEAEHLIDYWMPNKNWENCNVTDPSARVLPNYGASGT